MLEITYNKNTCPKKQTSQGMKIGDIAESLVPKGFLLRIYTGFVLLDKPDQTWNTHLDVEVRILGPGESVTLTVK